MIAYEFTEKSKPLKKVDKELGELPEGYERVKVAGCGLCHTDIGFLYTDVPTRKPLPLVLGHEISGVIEGGSRDGTKVIIPAVISCGSCPACLAGNPRICFKQIMPGNDIDGGFAEKIDVPGHQLVELPKDLDQDSLIRYSVIADAITTPLQAIHNLELKSGDLAVVIGCGGVGSFAALLALSRGAKVLAMDIDDRKLNKLSAAGAHHTFNVKGKDVREIKKWVKQTCKEEGYPAFAHKIFETSGTTPGQELAFALINHGAAMATVGFTMDKLNLRLSNLMAFDAKVVGNWGAEPKIYDEAVEIAMKGDLKLKEFTEIYPLDRINEVIEEAHHQGLDKRAVLVPA